jgi:hypothetical protein
VEANVPDLANPALKEWAAVNRALVEGRQIIDLRKGGIREQGHRFRVRALRFWLYDSVEHQRPELLRADLGGLLAATAAAAPPAGTLRFEAWAEIVESAALTEPEHVAALDGLHIWTPDYAVRRFRWRPKVPLLVLVLRVHRLAEPIEAPAREEYASCTSWVPMLDLPPDPRALAAAPVLGEDDFARRLRALHAALPGVTFAEPAVALEAG